MARVISDETWRELQEYRATNLKPSEIRRMTDGLQDLDAPLPMDLWNLGGCAMNSIRKFKCEKCQENIHGDAPLFLYQGAWVCGECLKDAMYDLDEFEVAELLGLETEDADTLGAEEAERSEKLWVAV